MLQLVRTIVGEAALGQRTNSNIKKQGCISLGPPKDRKHTCNLFVFGLPLGLVIFLGLS